MSVTKPLAKKDIDNFLKRFDSFIDSTIKEINLKSPTLLTITLEAQDSLRDFDWITITLEFSGVSDALIPKEEKISFIDMNEGITLITEQNEYLFAIGKYNTSNITDSICYIKSSALKYAEG